jgi:hypothetical protein
VDSDAPPKEARFSFLLIGLLITLVAGPLSAEFLPAHAGPILQLAFSATLIVAIWSLLDSRGVFVAGITLAIASAAATITYYFFPLPAIEMLGLACALTFCAMSLAFTVRHVFMGSTVDLNRMMGAICIYLLVGVMLGLINMFIARLAPGSFEGIDLSDIRSRGLDLIYYSFVTMTTLGYGDITPQRPLAKAIAYLAAVAGQFYIAILVGGMVGIYLSRRTRD